ncbi:2-amino-4-hydroxy-6-hydroxymethyldihydropteridine diphosphokinase [Aeromonas finlandensis]|uniref:2-amino-4-hydroxy-6- hydroxymethyldihydropteridine diphosphokinase n=1 Tax=Aeromonas finlandensis TaxID=1543375 RepID=UPI00051BC668|nr:2-amino-4-hydroxy-6-hydroxymethyldihydropteridine diphosphokinase [Aeromonas finlandensis]
MFYLCSIGSNLEPELHVSKALDELLAHFGSLQLSSVIRTKPVGMHSSHDFLNCLLVMESRLDAAHLKQRFVALEVAHGRDRSDPLCKVHDRPLDIDILANSTDGDFATTEVDSYLAELLAELYGHGEVHDPKVALQLELPVGSGKTVIVQQIGLAPTTLDASSQLSQSAPAIHLDAGPCHITVPHQ